MITGINHITLSVKNLDESFDFYKDVLGFKPLMKTPKSVYFLAGDLWFCIEEDSNVRVNSLPEYSHIAFKVHQKDFAVAKEKIVNSKTPLFKENKSEGDSVYFLDPNGHKLEIHVGDWQSRINHYKASNKDYQFFV